MTNDEQSTNKYRSSKGYWGVLFFIICLALFLRLLGINYSFPFIFHPDEPTIIRSALGIRFDVNPKHFDWPHLYIYLNYFIYMGFAFLRDLMVDFGYKNDVIKMFPIIWDDNLIFYLITRILTSILGALSVIPVYLTAKRLFGDKSALFAALGFALIPFHIRHSHYSLIDAPMVFLMSWGMYFSSKILFSKDLRNYILSGLFIGLSASTKYNGGLGAVFVPIAHLLRLFSQRVTLTKQKENLFNIWGIVSLLISGLFALIGFVMGTPYSVLDYKTFSRTDGPSGAFWQFTNVGSGGSTFIEHIQKMGNDLIFKLSGDLGYSILIVFALVFVLLCLKLVIKRSFDRDVISQIFLFVPTLLFIYFISGFDKSRSHYYMIFYPSTLVLFGYGVEKVCIYIKSKFENFSVLIILLWLSIVFSPLLIFSFKQSISFYNRDTRNHFYDWGNVNFKSYDYIYYEDSSLEIVVDKLGLNKFGLIKSRNFEDIKNSNIKYGYVVFSYESNLNSEEESGVYEQKYGDVVNTIQNSVYNYRVIETTTFSNNMRMGPNIVVMKFGL